MRDFISATGEGCKLCNEQSQDGSVMRSKQSQNRRKMVRKEAGDRMKEASNNVALLVEPSKSR